MMKERYKNRLNSLVGVLLLLIAVSCQNEQLPTDGPFDPDARIETTLGEINLDNDGTDTRAATTRLADGETFRVYAFRRGETDAAEIVVSYAYTMKGGKPVMNADQGDGKLYLPYGDLDVYLAGPLDVASAEEGVRLPVASSNGIIPRQGVDLIVSCTPVTISYVGSNQLNPVPLKHKMAKVKMRVNRKTEYAHMKGLELTKVEVFNQHMGVGEYTFSSTDGGAITPLPSDSVSGGSFVRQGADIQVTTEGKDYYASFMLLPREAGYLRTEIEMIITQQRPGEAERVDPYRMSGIIRNVPLVGGKHNLFLTEPVTSADIVWRPTLLPWNDQEPIDTPVGGEMVLYLDGRDAPEMIDGKLCWRDRSGNGYHAEISPGIVYNKERRCYEFPTDKDFMLIPDLGLIPEYTLELLAENTRLSDRPMLNFRAANADARDLCIHLPSGTDVFFDSGQYKGGSGGRIYHQISADPIYYHTFRTYFFKKEMVSGGKLMSLGVNGSTKKFETKVAANATHGAFQVNQIGGIFQDAPTGVENFRIRSVRLYRKALSETELKSNYESDNSIYKQDPEVVTNGLILLLDGKVPPYVGIDKGAGDYKRPRGEMYWPDMSGKENHARYVYRKDNTFNRLTTGFIAYTGRGYRFNNLNTSDCSFMELIKTLGENNNNFTLEMVIASEREGATTFHTGPNLGLTTDRAIGIHLPFRPDTSKDPVAKRIVFDGPRYNNGASQNRITYTGPYVSVAFTSQIHHYAFMRDHQKINKVVVDGEEISSLVTDGKVSTAPSIVVPEMKYTYIGNLVTGTDTNPDGSLKQPKDAFTDYFVGEICAVRLYNRVLTPDEITKNSRADKARYGY